jgi:hypothetical protein
LFSALSLARAVAILLILYLVFAEPISISKKETNKQRKSQRFQSEQNRKEKKRNAPHLSMLNFRLEHFGNLVHDFRFDEVFRSIV